MTEWEEKFIHFLQENNAFDAYMHNAETLKPAGNMENILNFPKAFITTAFNFSSTKEGVQYWMDLHKKWELICGNVTYIPDNELVNIDG